MAYPGESSVYTWEEYIFCCCWIECSVCLLDPLHLWCIQVLFPYWSFIWIFYPLFKVRYWNLLMLLCYYLSFPSILSVFSSYIWCSAIRYIYLFNCYIYPINWLFYHLSCPSLSLLTVFDLKSILSSMIMAHPVPCSLLVTICIFFCIL